jgi:hypothetical protein
MASGSEPGVNGNEARFKERHWIVLFFSVLVSAGFAVVLGQDAGFDLLNYHYYSGFALLRKPFGYDFAPAQIQSFHNPLIHVLSYAVLANLPAKAAAALIGAIQGLNFYLVFQISQVLFSNLKSPYRLAVGLVTAGAGFYGIASNTELGATYGDNLISLLVLSGLLLILRRLRTVSTEDPPAAAVIALAGFLIGAAFGLKFTSAIYVAAVAISLPLVLLNTRKWGRSTAALAGGLIIGFLAAYGFWGAYLYSEYGNPFFPYLNAIFQSPYFEKGNFLDVRFFPKNWLQSLFYPFFFIQKTQLVSEVEFRDVRLALCYVAIALISGIGLVRFVMRIRTESKPDRVQRNLCLAFLVWFLLISYVGWLHFSSIYRYLCVLELMAPLFLVYAIGCVFRSEAFIVWFSALLGLVVFLFAVPVNFGRQGFDSDLLKLRIPPISGLDRSLVLMTGYEPAAYVVPSFPAATRFVRISSTFTTPGRNLFVDREIRKILAAYDAQHTFAFVSKEDEIGLARLDASAYGIPIDAHSCFEIRSREKNRGYLCGIAGSRAPTREQPAPDLRYRPKFAAAADALLKVWSEKDFIHARIAGIKTGAVDLLYELDGEMMPGIRNWPLDTPAQLNLGPLGRSGTYRIIGIRRSGDPQPDLWIKVDASVRLQISG